MLSTQARTSSGPGLAATACPSVCLPPCPCPAGSVGRQDVRACPALSAHVRYFLSIPACEVNIESFVIVFLIINVVISITAHFELFFDGLVERLQFCGASVWNDRKTGVALKGVFVLLSDDIHTILKTYYVDRDFLKILMLSDKRLAFGGHGALPNGQ